MPDAEAALLWLMLTSIHLLTEFHGDDTSRRHPRINSTSGAVLLYVPDLFQAWIRRNQCNEHTGVGLENSIL